ncbi:signal recognition particle subunit SRP14 [Plasmodium brasilianum]|uniref:Signal recognition particle 14 kDa protein n=2 Tax=Plasmodium (Plasmodium) TaxID=418103 RepID=A0A1A8WRU9_PLAMA|nr:signal recognition particle subunit SRP14 [Plasmodium brasilianum]SBS94590.1 signal recognition particle subunit SRP14, putative (SRP14) [Plasmodium malariae]
MVLLSNSLFIEEFRKLCAQDKEEGKTSIWLTMKKVKRSDIKICATKKGPTEKIKKKNNKENMKTNKKYICLIRATDGKKEKISTHVYDNVLNFSQELNNIIKVIEEGKFEKEQKSKSP